MDGCRLCLYFLISYAGKRWEVDSKAFCEASIVFSESEASHAHYANEHGPEFHAHDQSVKLRLTCSKMQEERSVGPEFEA